MFNIIRILLKAFVTLFYRVRFEGVDNFPKKGALVLCANHTFVKDLIFIGSVAPRKIYWMAKIELFRIPLFGPLIKSLGAFPVDRGARDKDSIRNVYKVLQSGKPLGIFPEGTRHTEPTSRPPFKRSFVAFAANTGASILPVALRYEGGPFGRGRIFSRAVISFGELITMDQNHKYGRGELDNIAESIMSRINDKIIINNAS